ncbi:MAG: tetratricopeptide repeat protein [Gammaproteobacteria bacterium]|nr:tetratricopeptide repeat protein [Gammaproteobacteria bacterium]
MIGRQSPRYWVAGMCATILSCGVTFAQVDNFLDEDNSTEVDQDEAGTTESENPENSNLNLTILFKKLNDLESENRTLVGRIETLEYELDKMRQENRERYTDLDERVRALSGQATLQSGDVDVLDPDRSTEGGMYRTAVNHIGEQEYDEAISVLNEMIETYPNGNHVPMGFYYLGELYRTKDPKELEEARQNFVQLIRLHPEHAKVGEAKYKLGTIYDELGDSSTALDYLDEVVQEYPGTSAARLAKEYATTLREAENDEESTE